MSPYSLPTFNFPLLTPYSDLQRSYACISYFAKLLLILNVKNVYASNTSVLIVVDLNSYLY